MVKTFQYKPMCLKKFELKFALRGGKMYLNGINFRELENIAFREDLFSQMSVLQFFARIYFRESAMLRIFVNTNFHESAILRYFASTVFIFANRLFPIFRGYLFREN